MNVGVVLDARSSNVAIQRDVPINFRIDPDRFWICNVFNPISDQVRMRFSPDQRTTFHDGNEAT